MRAAQLFLVCLLAVGAAALAQVSVSGVVQDPSGATIAAAAVVLKNAGRQQQATKTDLTGGFRFGPLNPGIYDIETSQEGFRNSKTRLRVGLRTPAPLRIAPGFVVLDLRWSRDFFLMPSKKDKGPAATIAMDAFNALNRVNYAGIVGNLSSPFFGQAVASKPARRLQISFRFRF
jgi:hypothetical protein